MRVRVLVIGVFLNLSGCSGNDNEPAAASAPADPPHHVWEEQVKSIDKARQLEEDMNDAFRRRSESIDTQSH